MENKVNWIITDDSIVVNYDGQTHQLSRTDACAPKLITALKEKRFNDIPGLISSSLRLEKNSGGKFTVKNGEVYVDGVLAPKVLGCKIEEFANEGLPYEPLVKFAKNLQANPSFRAVNELYQFLEKNNHPITETGNFLAYKKVKENFTDVYTGTFDNSPGKTLEMPRNLVDDNPNVHCSNGFHVGNWRYCHEFNGSQGHMLEVEVNPADVISVPNDLLEKIRVCKYKVLGVVEEELSTSSLRVVNPSYKPSYLSDENDEEEDYCEVCDEYHDGDSCEEEEECEEDCKECNEEDEYDWEDEIET